MGMKKLVRILQEHEQCIKEFFGCSVEKQNAIVNCDCETLKRNLQAEESLLTLLEKQSAGISAVIGEIAKENQLELEHNSLSEFMDSVKHMADMDVKVIKLLQNSIRNLVINTTKVNDQNRILIEHARSFLKDTINYLVKSQKHNLLDRRL
jgi:hypothetical protein